MIARDVECSTCNATAGQPCRSLVSRHAGKAHAARENAAIDATQALKAAGLGDFSAAKARRDERTRMDAQMGARP